MARSFDAHWCGCSGLLAALAVSVATCVMPTTSLGAAPASSFKDPHGIGCPAAPEGWSIIPGDNTIRRPGGRTVVAPGDVEGHLGDVGSRGGNGVQIGCDYFRGTQNHVTVELLYALPTDPNPNNDFYFGCGNGGQKWDESFRTFRLADTSQWAIVAFLDPARQLDRSDVSAFEGVAGRLLRNADGFAHDCTLDVQPTATISQFSFVFETPGGDMGKGLFYTSVGRPSASSWPVVSAAAHDITLHVKLRGKRYPVTVHVRRGVTYVPETSKRKPAVRLAVVVKSSKVPACPRHSTGTLTISAQPFLRLAVCSRSFEEQAAASITPYSR
jgi:hypothetical protein